MAVTIALLTLAAAALLARGFRGRRTDDHPLCRRCQFDLTGRPPTSTRCPECGADLTPLDTVLVGRRQRRPKLIFAGLLLALLAPGTWEAGEIYQYPNRYKPVWWLMADLRAGGSIHTGPAIDQFEVRSFLNRLTPQQTSAFIDALLVVQADDNWAWRTEDGDFLLNLREKHVMTSEQWMRFLRQSLRFRLRVRDRVRQSDPIPAELQLLPGRAGAGQFSVKVLPKISIADGTGEPARSGSDHLLRSEVTGTRYDTGNSASAPFHVRLASATGGLPELGPHTVTARFQVEMFDEGDWRHVPRLLAEDVTLSAPVVIVADSVQTVRPADPAFVAAARSMFDVQVSRSPQTGRLSTLLSSTRDEYGWIRGGYQTAGHFDVSLRAGVSERHIGQAQAMLADGSDQDLDECKLPVKVGDSVDVVLRSPPAMARDSVDQTMYLADEVVIRNVPVK